MEYHINESSLGKIGYEETVTTNREIVANHLEYIHLYMFLVAEWGGCFLTGFMGDVVR